MDHYKAKQRLKKFFKRTDQSAGTTRNNDDKNNWTCKEAHLTVVEDGHDIIIGKDMCTSLGLSIVEQQTESGKGVNNINNSTCKIKVTIAAQFSHLVFRIGLSKTHVAKSKFHQKFTAKHQKGRHVPLTYKVGSRRS